MSSAAPSSTVTPPFDHVVIVGVGLIGGSIGKALKTRGLTRCVTGLGRDRERLHAAQKAGVIDRFTTSVREIGPFTQAIVCTPVDRIIQDIEALRTVAASDSWITDAGSVKEAICNGVQAVIPTRATYIGSHPMAGSERGGWEHASADLFAGRVCAITPQGQPEPVIASVERFWESLGMQTVRLDPDRHDQIVGLTSHLPHVAAAAIASLLTAEGWPLAASGFRDTTRIAGGDPTLWTSILMENRHAITPQLRRLIDVLNEFTTALDSGRPHDISGLLTQGQSARAAWQQDLESRQQRSGTD